MAAKKGIFRKVAGNFYPTESPKKAKESEHVAGHEFELSVEEAEKIKEEEEKMDDIPRMYGKLLHIIKVEIKKEPRLIDEIQEIIGRPKKKKSDTELEFMEYVIKKPKRLKEMLVTLIDRRGEDDERYNKEIQGIVNSLATELPNNDETPAKKEKPKKKEKAEPSYELPDNSDRKAYIREMISAIRRDPELRLAIKDANLEPYSIDQYFDVVNDPFCDNPLSLDDEKIKNIIYSPLCDGDKEKALKAGLIKVERFVADEHGNSTGIPFPKDSPKGKS